MDRNKTIVRTSLYGIAVNFILVAFKATVGLIANSISVILDAVNNLTDALSSVITIVGTKLAAKAPDKDHPYGHGRAEYLTSAIIAEIILYAGITSAKESVEKIIHPESADYSVASLIVIASAVAVKFFFGRYVKSVGKKVNSKSLVASGEDAFMDSVISFATLVAAGISYFFHLSLEGYLGVVISLFIIKTAVEILKDTVYSILGGRAEKGLTDELKKTVLEFPEVEGVYDMSLHDYGPSKTVGSLHIQVRDDMTAEKIHILTRRIQYKVYEKFGITLSVGIYASNEEGEFAQIKKDVNGIAGEYPSVLQVHGFYVDREASSVFFDLIIDFGEKDKNGVLSEITERLHKKYPQYTFNVILDSDVSDV